MHETTPVKVLEEKIKALEKIMSTRKTPQAMGSRYQHHANLIAAIEAAKKRESN